MDGFKTIAEISRDAGLPEATCRRYCTKHGRFFPFRFVGRRKKYPLETIRVLKHVADLYGMGLESAHVEQVLLESMPGQAVLDVEPSGVTKAPPHADASGLAVFAGAVDRLAAALERFAAVQERRAEIMEDRLASLEAARTPQDRRKPLSATREPSEAPTARTSRPDALNLVLELHREGLGSRAIARRLNEAMMPTISGKGRWAKGIVRKLLAEAGL